MLHHINKEIQQNKYLNQQVVVTNQLESENQNLVNVYTTIQVGTEESATLGNAIVWKIVKIEQSKQIEY